MATQPTSRQTVFTGPATPPKKPVGEVFMHLVLFKLYNTATEEIRDTALRLMDEMCQTDDVLKYELAESMDTRKGYILSEKIIFTDQKAFDTFKATDAHTKYAAFISQHADWVISDYLLPAALV